MPKVNIIVTTRDGLDNTKVCIKSLKTNTKHPHRIIVVDDTSQDGSLEWLRHQEGITLIENEGDKAHGVYVGLQIGMDFEKADYYVFCERDAVYTPYWLTNLLEVTGKDPKIGMIACMSNGGAGDHSLQQGGPESPENPVQIYWRNRLPKRHPDNWLKNYGRRWVPWWLTYDEIMEFGEFVKDFFYRKYRHIGLIWWGHNMVSHRCITDVPLDLRFFRANGDNDWCLRAVKKGWKLAVRMDTYAHTQPSDTISVAKGWALPNEDVRLYEELYPHEPNLGFMPAGEITDID